jgi:DNA-binding XRE family transcriptional regulator
VGGDIFLEPVFLPGVNEMKEVPDTSKAPAGLKARQMRISRLMTRRELADMAGVYPEEVNLFEQNLPVPLDARRRILKTLWAKK